MGGVPGPGRAQRMPVRAGPSPGFESFPGLLSPGSDSESAVGEPTWQLEATVLVLPVSLTRTRAAAATAARAAAGRGGSVPGP
jgi:hypothetical protein